MNDGWREHLAVIVIGRNEATRLGDCLDSISSLSSRAIYVDSGSSDRSPDLARLRGVKVIELKDGPFTAARGRQVGVQEILSSCPDTRYIQFVDGDCVVQAGWLEHAVKFLDEHSDVAVVVGRLRERYADKSLLLRLVNVDWDLPTGEIDAIGGICMMRASALRDVGGWRTDLIAGEELDLGARLRAVGWRLVRLPDEMALHDMGIETIGEFWRRSVRSGFSYTELAFLHGRSRYRRWMRRAIGNLFYGAVLPVVFLAFAMTWFPGALAVAPLYLILLARVTMWRVRRGDDLKLAFLYSLMLVFCKCASAIGTIKYLNTRLTGKERRLIEYKTALSGEGR